MRFFLAALAVAVVSAVPRVHIHQAVQKIDCSPLAAKYCTKDIGCLERNGACFADPKGPSEPLNCTRLFIVSGGAVQDATKSLTDNLKLLKDLSNEVMKNYTKILDTLGAASSKYDNALVKYNQTLTIFNTAEAQLQLFSDQLDALELTCSMTTPPPPPTCPADIEKLQEKIAAQNATCAKIWLQVQLNKQLMDLSYGLVKDAEDTVAPGTDKASSSYMGMQKLIQDFTQDKTDAIAYWSVIKDVCSGTPPPMVPVPSAKKHKATVA